MSREINDLDRNVAELVRRARLSEGLSQKQLAEAINTVQPAIARYESGGVRNLARLQDIAEVLDRKVHIELLENV